MAKGTRWQVRKEKYDCYFYMFERGSKETEDRGQGENRLDFYTSEVPFDFPEDFGTWSHATYDALYLGSERKEPAEGFLMQTSDLTRIR